MADSEIEKELERLAALETKATPGPWTQDPDERDCIVEECAGDTYRVVSIVTREPIGTPNWGDNAALISAARNALPALIAEVRLLREALRYEFCCGKCGDTGEDYPGHTCVCEECALLRPDRKLGEP